MASPLQLSEVCLNHENICDQSNPKSAESKVDVGVNGKNKMLKKEPVIVEEILDGKDINTEFNEGSGANNQCDQDVKCTNCNKNFPNGSAIRNISRLTNVSCSGDNDNCVVSTEKTEVLSVMTAMNVLFNLHQTWTDKEDNYVLCELCGKHLELAYNAFHDFMLLSKSESVMHYKTQRLKKMEKIRFNNCFPKLRLGKDKDCTKSKGSKKQRSKKDKRLPKVQQKRLQKIGENRTCSKKKIKITTSKTNQPLSEQRQKQVRKSISKDTIFEKGQNEETITILLPRTCTICNIEFNGEDFDEHFKIHDPLNLPEDMTESNIDEDKFIKSARAQTNAKLNKVKKIRPEKVCLSCYVCGKKFFRPDHLKLHVRIHTGEKPLSCNLCGKTFSDPRGLSYHEITHSDERPYCCTICGFTFKRLHHLKDHEKNHTDVPRPFTCSICGKAFKHKKHLNSHSVTHQATKQHQCTLCSRYFNRKDNLRQHIKTVHEKDPEEKTSKKLRSRKALVSSGTSELISTSTTSAASTNVSVVPLVTTTATSLAIPVAIHIPEHDQIVYMHL